MKWALSFLLMLVVSATVFGQVSGPRIKFDTTTIDVGKVQRGSEVGFDFWYTNVGDEPLILYGVKNTCGCNPARWSNEPVPPKGRGLIHGYYDRNRIGPINKSLFVTCNDPVNDTLFLHERGDILPDSSTSTNDVATSPINDYPWPRELILPLGVLALPIKEKHLVKVPFQNNSFEEIEITNVYAQTGIEVVDWTRGVIQPRYTCFIEIRITPEKGAFSRSLLVTTTSRLRKTIPVKLVGEFR